ncbi:MAG: sulfotransferase domain-containing protein [Pseudomonadota bacterium]
MSLIEESAVVNWVRKNIPQNLKNFIRPLVGPVVGTAARLQGPLSERPLPNFLVIGSQKAGTTSLFSWLCQHPDIMAPVSKELGYLETPRKAQKGADGYRLFFRPITDGQITGEATPSYIFFPDTAETAFNICPDIKVVALLRHPKDRAISHYFHSKRMGAEHEEMMRAFELEDERLASAYSSYSSDSTALHRLRHFSYAARGRYTDLLKPWFERFSPSNVMLIRSEHMFAHPQDVLVQVHDFLGVGEHPMDAIQPKMTGTYDSPTTADAQAFIEEKLRDDIKAYEAWCAGDSSAYASEARSIVA